MIVFFVFNFPVCFLNKPWGLVLVYSAVRLDLIGIEHIPHSNTIFPHNLSFDMFKCRFVTNRILILP